MSFTAAISDHARRTPERVVLSDATRTLTYHEFDAETDRVAAAIVRSAGPALEPVGILLDQTVDAVVALCAVMKARKIALPLDGGSPAAAIAEVIDHAGARLVVTDDRGQQLLRATSTPLLFEHARAAPPDATNSTTAVEPTDDAIIWYTSGSTGRPKGVVLNHRDVMVGTRAWAAAYEIRPDDRCALIFHHSFAASRVCLFGALGVGAELRVYDVGQLGLVDLGAALEADDVTFTHCGASLLRAVLEHRPEGPNYPRLRRVLLGAERLHRHDIERLRRQLSPECVLVNLYSMSEASPVCALFVAPSTVLDDVALPVGAPLLDTRISIADPDLDGIGEILVGGSGLASGYWHDTVQTAERFIADPRDPAAVVFRTGDRGRLRPDGVLEHHGRLGTLVKLRGFNVDLAAVERALLEAAPLAEVAIVVHEGHRRRLVAYVVGPSSDPRCHPAQLRAALTDRLPRYMIPTAFVPIDSLPRTSRGKVDVDALPPVPIDRPELGTPFVAPRNDLERAIAAAWEHVLDVRPIGVDDDFLALGGDSLVAAESVSLLQESIGEDVPMTVFLTTTTVARVATTVSARDGALTPLVALRSDGDRPPLVCVHGRGGHVLPFRTLAEHLSDDQPVYALQLAGTEAKRSLRSVERLAAHYIEHLRVMPRTGPLTLAGFSFGGLVAFEMARQLATAGDPPGLLVLLDVQSPTLGRQRLAARPVRRILGRLRLDWRVLVGNVRGHRDREWITLASHRAVRRYHPRRYHGAVVLVRTATRSRDLNLGWAALTTDLKIVETTGGHRSMLEPPYVASLAEHLERHLEQAWTATRQDAPTHEGESVG